MSELRIFYKEKEKIRIARTLDILKELDKKDIIWIDLVDVKEEVENESVVINGLVEGSYNFEVYQLGWRLVNPEPVVVPLSAE